MKELSIEEKAKAYDKAIEEAKSAHKDYKKQLDGIDQKSNAALIINGAISALEILFPELKESEDERIRKELLAVIDDLILPDEQKERFVAWLKKQGNNIDISETTKQELEDNLHKALEKETTESWNEFLDKKGEQKPEKVDNLHNYLYGEQKPVEWNSEQSKTLQTDDVPKESSTAASFRTGAIGFDGEPMESKPCKQNPTWSKEDEYVIETLLCLLHNEQDKYPQQSSEFQELEEIENKLKSLKERYTWKPSEKEMVALEHAINCYSGISPTNTNEVFTLEIMKERLKNLMK